MSSSIGELGELVLRNNTFNERMFDTIDIH